MKVEANGNASRLRKLRKHGDVRNQPMAVRLGESVWRVRRGSDSSASRSNIIVFFLSLDETLEFCLPAYFFIFVCLGYGD
jgi:hypothetical protein